MFKKQHSKHAKRMNRHHSRMGAAGLNLVSLMDIFTILVFFLLVNSSNTQQLPNSDSIKLPKSTAEQLPKETLVILVSNDEILVQGRKVADIGMIISDKKDDVPALAKELKYQAAKSAPVIDADGQPAREVTIMGHKEIPYTALKKIMLTCSENEYTRISLAVLKKAEEANPS